ncbi:MAG: ABC transporter ATP-binding protein [Gammaproteobacteria bacterium]|nr:ABC transporter ATP-binding protein [Gammaproteobacteria bacterium]
MTDNSEYIGSEPLVEIRDMYFSRGPNQIFKGLSLDIRRGQVTGFMGPSGTGKTTLLKLIGGQLKPQEGKVFIQGQDVNAISRASLFELRKRMGMLFQSGALLTDINVFENVAFPLREHTKLPEQIIRDLVLMKLEAVGLRGARKLMPSQLSGGMARRVALARAIVLDPMMIMYDEPFTGLDPITKGTIVTLIKQLNNVLGLTSIIVSHDVEETLSIADYIYVISDGEIIESGTPASLRKSSSEWVQQFLNGYPDGPAPFHYPAPEYIQDLLVGR